MLLSIRLGQQDKARNSLGTKSVAICYHYRYGIFCWLNIKCRVTNQQSFIYVLSDELIIELKSSVLLGINFDFDIYS